MFEKFVRGHTYSYQDVNKEIGYTPTKKLQKAILAVPIPERHSVMIRIKEDVDYYEDRFDPESDILYYIGQGKPEQGHHSPINENKRIIENENKDFYLFVQPKGQPSWWTYYGKWRLVNINPSYESEQMIGKSEKQLVFRFKFVRQGSATEVHAGRTYGNVAPTRYDSIISRMHRDSALSEALKEEYNHRCQICCETIETPDSGRYCEVHHIKPLGSPHNGPDIRGNIIVLYPNHHVEMNRGAFYTRWPDMKVQHFNLSNPYHGRTIWRQDTHKLRKEYLDYHKSKICRDWIDTISDDK